ncbi:Uncharacterized protein DBV15_11683, partial [Temnothorax longispinosus]
IFPIIKECSEGLAKYLDNKAQMRDSIEIKDICKKLLYKSYLPICSNCIEEPNNDEYRIQGKNILKIKIIRFILSMSIPKIMDIFFIPLTYRRITTHKVIKHDFMNLLIQLMEKGYVDDDKKTTDFPYICLKNLLILLKKTILFYSPATTINKLTMAEAIAQSFIFFLAGFETSTATATFALYELAHHRDIQDKVHKEIDETDSEEISTSSNVESHLYQKY